MTQRDLTKAEQLSREGIAFSNSLTDANKPYFDELDNSYFSIASAIGLTWTKHAKFESTFITYAADYIDEKCSHDLEIVRNYSYRFGPEELENALLNYRKYYKSVKSIMPNFHQCNINELGRLQQNLLNRLHTLRNTKIVSGIGPWLFTGPFKIILGDQTRLWSEHGINAIVLPTGIEVNRAIDRLISERYAFVKDFDRNWLLDGPNSLLDSYATYSLVHTFIVNIGRITSTPGVHINSALYLYGRDEI